MIIRLPLILFNISFLWVHCAFISRSFNIIKNVSTGGCTENQLADTSGYCYTFLFEPPHDKTYKMTCTPSEDSDQPGHLASLIRAFAVPMKKARVLSYPLSAQRRLISLSQPGRTYHFVGFVMRRLILFFRFPGSTLVFVRYKPSCPDLSLIVTLIYLFVYWVKTLGFRTCK